jgi:Reverse transcriptase (RNA-dependent DNA polymerase)
MKKGDEWKVAFYTNCSLFEPLVMFFGSTKSPITVQTMMDSISEGLISKEKIIIYLDDILVFTETLEEH